MIKLSQDILKELKQMNFSNFPRPIKAKNIFEYINELHVKERGLKNKFLYTSDLYKTLPTLICINRLFSSKNLIKLISRLGIKAPTVGTLPLIRIDRPEDKFYATPWHQDFWFSQISHKALVFWSPLGKFTQDMGFLKALPGYKRILNFKKKKFGREPYEPKLKIDERQAVKLNCKFGEFLIFKQSLLHRSSYNKSKKCRVSLQLRFNEMYGNSKPVSSVVAKHSDYVVKAQNKYLK